MPAEAKFAPVPAIVSTVIAEIATVVKRRKAADQITLIMTCAGRTPKAVYQGLKEGALTPEEWATVHFGVTDEFAPSTERPNTNRADLEEMFFRDAVQCGLIPTMNLHWFNPQTDWELSIPEYEAEIRALGGPNVVILGAGGGTFWPGAAVDPGHVAGIMPGHPELWSDSAAMFATIHDSPKPPRNRMTLTARAIHRTTDLVLAIVTGKEKAGTVANYFTPSIEPVQCPLKVIDGASARSLFLTNVQITELS